MRSYLKSDCEGIDAAIFSGDVLWVDAERAELKTYVERWARAIVDHERWARLIGSHETEEMLSIKPRPEFPANMIIS